MRCSKCIEEGKKSKVFVHGSSSTLLAWSPYYDEDGNYVSDDPNITTTDYSCSNGHRFYGKRLGREEKFFFLETEEHETQSYNIIGNDITKIME